MMLIVILLLLLQSEFQFGGVFGLFEQVRADLQSLLTKSRVTREALKAPHDTFGQHLIAYHRSGKNRIREILDFLIIINVLERNLRESCTLRMAFLIRNIVIASLLLMLVTIIIFGSGLTFTNYLFQPLSLQLQMCAGWLTLMAYVLLRLLGRNESLKISLNSRLLHEFGEIWQGLVLDQFPQHSPSGLWKACAQLKRQEHIFGKNLRQERVETIKNQIINHGAVDQIKGSAVLQTLCPIIDVSLGLCYVMVFFLPIPERVLLPLVSP